MKKQILLLGATAGILALGTTAGAVAGSMVTSAQIQDNTIRSSDLKDGSAVGLADLKPGLSALVRKGAKAHGAAGAVVGAPGKDGLFGGYYAVAFYDVGDTNAGAIATVACKNTTDTAVSGGVQVLGIDADANSRNTPVSSSFPGRMDWSTNSPKADRTDGWIVQFGGTDKAPEKAKVWALCVPNQDIPVVETYRESD